MIIIRMRHQLMVNGDYFIFPVENSVAVRYHSPEHTRSTNAGGKLYSTKHRMILRSGALQIVSEQKNIKVNE